MKANYFRPFLLVAASLAMFQAGVVSAETTQATYPPPGHAKHFDWVKHTQGLLDTLKGKLSLTETQESGWDTWAAGVQSDARAQADNIQELNELRHVPSAQNLTTPEYMAQHAEALQETINRMQAHLARLKAAQERTQAFYDKLDSKQKTIFDLFWKVEFREHMGHGHGHGQMNHGASPQKNPH